jgi:RNase H-like domain found in reverse transcriptase
LGFIVGREGLQIDETKTEALRKALPPRTKTELRRFLGMTGFYRKFIPNYARVAAPLNRFLKADVSEDFELDEAALSSHRSLKEAIICAPVLALPKREGSFVLEADASATQLGVVLLQQQEDGKFKPIGHWSR